MKKFILLCLLLFSVGASATTLITDNYVVTIDVNCSEGNVSCNDVTYEGVSRKSGNSISLKGETWHSLCADGITPCKFLGYIFKKGSYNYLVYESGLLQITLGENKVLVERNGMWVY